MPAKENGASSRRCRRAAVDCTKSGVIDRAGRNFGADLSTLRVCGIGNPGGSAAMFGQNRLVA